MRPDLWFKDFMARRRAKCFSVRREAIEAIISRCEAEELYWTRMKQYHWMRACALDPYKHWNAFSDRMDSWKRADDQVRSFGVDLAAARESRSDLLRGAEKHGY